MEGGEVGYSNKTWCCPFFKRDERLCVYCEGGQVRFYDLRCRNEYINRYCATVPGWKSCTIAGYLVHYYERKDAGHG